MYDFLVPPHFTTSSLIVIYTLVLVYYLTLFFTWHENSNWNLYPFDYFYAVRSVVRKISKVNTALKVMGKHRQELIGSDAMVRRAIFLLGSLAQGQLLLWLQLLGLAFRPTLYLKSLLLTTFRGLLRMRYWAQLVF